MAVTGKGEPDRHCVVCDGSMSGKRRHALTCSPPCRAERSRIKRVLDGVPTDGARSLAQLMRRHQKRTGSR